MHICLHVLAPHDRAFSRGAGFPASSPPLLGRERAAVDVDVGPERRSPRYHETRKAALNFEFQGCMKPFLALTCRICEV